MQLEATMTNPANSNVPVLLSQELTDASKAVLEPGESLEEFVEAALRIKVNRRQVGRALRLKGLAAAERARLNGSYVTSDAVLDRLNDILRKRLHGKP